MTYTPFKVVLNLSVTADTMLTCKVTTTIPNDMTHTAFRVALALSNTADAKACRHIH